jgi:hypothetical protein
MLRFHDHQVRGPHQKQVDFEQVVSPCDGGQRIVQGIQSFPRDRIPPVVGREPVVAFFRGSSPQRAKVQEASE